MTDIDPHVPAHEHDVLRLYSVDTGQSAGRTLRDALESGGPAADRAAAEALGVDRAESKWLGLVDMRDVAEMGIESYLAQGYDVPRDQIAAARERLERASGQILVVPSRTFAGEAVTIDAGSTLRPLVQFVVDEALAPAQPMAPADMPERTATAPRSPGFRTGLGQLGPVQILAIVIAVAVLIGLFTQL